MTALESRDYARSVVPWEEQVAYYLRRLDSEILDLGERITIDERTIAESDLSGDLSTFLGARKRKRENEQTLRRLQALATSQRAALAGSAPRIACEHCGDDADVTTDRRYVGGRSYQDYHQCRDVVACWGRFNQTHLFRRVNGGRA